MASKKRVIISCISEDLKKVLSEEISVNALLDELQLIPECIDGAPIGFGKGSKVQGEKKKREPSAYNIFVSQCMKSKNIKGFGEAPKAMKECAVEWREKKKTLKS